jgi:hypothetical protein
MSPCFQEKEPFPMRQNTDKRRGLPQSGGLLGILGSHRETALDPLLGKTFPSLHIGQRVGRNKRSPALKSQQHPLEENRVIADLCRNDTMKIKTPRVYLPMGLHDSSGRGHAPHISQVHSFDFMPNGESSRVRAKTTQGHHMKFCNRSWTIENWISACAEMTMAFVSSWQSVGLGSARRVTRQK